MNKVMSKMLVSSVGTRFTSKVAAAAFASVLSFGSANAIVVGGGITGGTAVGAGGAFIELTAPFVAPIPGGSPTTSVVGNNTFQLPNLYAFNEDQNIVLPNALNVDVGPNGTTNFSIANGTTVASHYVFFDPAGSTSITGYVDFDAAIIGVATSTASLFASDILQNNLVNYLSPGLRGLEGQDSVSVIAAVMINDNKRLWLDWTASTPGDYVRVFTEYSVGAVPVPAALPLFGTGLALLGVLGWRRKRRAR
ncbi:MAG: PEP-CTERM sorting domain-containing protein [Rhizobiaceae bacterium]